MTIGQLVFYAGIGLLLATIMLAVIFVVKKPEYHPENAASPTGNGTTVPLHNGYPTDTLTIRRDRPEQAHPVAPDETVSLQSQEPETILLGTETVPLSDSTMPLEQQDTAPLEPEDTTVPLKQSGTSQSPLEAPDETALL